MALFVLALVLGCADAPPKRTAAAPNGGGVAHSNEPLGNEPGGKKANAACISLGLEREVGEPDPSISRDVAAAQKDFERATKLFDAGDYQAALEAYRRAAGADPFHGLAHLGVAESHLYTDNDAASMQAALTRALSLMPTNPRAHLRAGEVAAERGEKQRAEAHLKCALELRPDYPDAQRRLAKYLYVEQRYPEAEEAISSLAGAEASSDVEALMLAADIFEASKKFRQAAERVELAATAAKGSAPLWRRAANLYESAGNLVAAKKARAAADKIDPPKKERNLRPLQKARRGK